MTEQSKPVVSQPETPMCMECRVKPRVGWSDCCSVECELKRAQPETSQPAYIKELLAAAESALEWERSYRTINHLGARRPDPFNRLHVAIETASWAGVVTSPTESAAPDRYCICGHAHHPGKECGVAITAEQVFCGCRVGCKPESAASPEPPKERDCKMLDAIMKAAKQIHEEFDCLSDHVKTKKQIREQIASIIWKQIESVGAASSTPVPTTDASASSTKER